MLASYAAVEEYAADPDMQQGFAIIEISGPKSKPVFSVRNHVVVQSGGNYYVC